MQYHTLEQKMQLEEIDRHSNHKWRYEVDVVATTVDIYKNGKHVRKVPYVMTPVRAEWLREQREGL